MIVRLTPGDIADRWSSLKDGFLRAVPPNSGKGDALAARILESCLSGRMQVWAWLDNEEVKAAALTTMITDPGTGVINLMIYALYSTALISDAIYFEGIDVIRTFAKDNGCFAITAYSDNKRVDSIANIIGMKKYQPLYYLEVS